MCSVTYSCCPEPYPDVTFTLHLRRKPGFFLYNIIIPCLVITSLAVLTFVLPPDIGERVTLVIESFLALSFVVLMVSDNVPVTSDSTPLLTKFLIISMCQIGGALVANCISLNLYRKYEMPQWVRVVFLHYLARCLCINSGQPKERIERHQQRVPSRSADLMVIEAKKLSGTKPLGSPGGHSLSSPTHSAVMRRAYQDNASKIADGLAELAQFEIKRDEHIANRNFWIFVSRVVDRLFLLAFSIAFVCSSCMIFSQVPDHYNLLLWHSGDRVFSIRKTQWTRKHMKQSRQVKPTANVLNVLFWKRNDARSNVNNYGFRSYCSQIIVNGCNSFRALLRNRTRGSKKVLLILKWENLLNY